MKIKICGFTSVDEVRYIEGLSVDFAGVVMFYPKSKRNTPPEVAKRIIESLPKETKSVAVVVSPQKEWLQDIEKLGFDYVQIHGTIDEELLSSINIPVLKAFNVDDMDKFPEYEKNDNIKGYVFDAAAPGSGKVFDWNLLTTIERTDKIFILAGGLSTDNVVEAIRKVRPDGVDVSSSVERDDGMGKDPDKIREFVELVRKAGC